MTDHEETMTVSTVMDASTVTNKDAPDSSERVSGCALTDVQQRLLATASESWGKAGGPVQYLKARYAGPKEKQEFADAVLEKFSPDPTVTYTEAGPIPDNTASNHYILLHPTKFEFSDDASLKSLPEVNTSLRLAEEILVGGFLSHSEPVQIKVLFPDAAALAIHSVGYVKGQARVCTLIALMSHIMDSGLDPCTCVPKLYETARVIYCNHKIHSSQRDEVFDNFQSSTRGSIRKPPHTFQWVSALQTLRMTDDGGVTTVIKAWNQNVSKASQLHGAKSVGVRNVLSLMPEQVYNILARHVSLHGWENSALSDDVLQSKRIYPGHVFRSSANKEWMWRGKITPESMCLSVQQVLDEFERAPSRLRQRPSRSQWEEVSAASCALVSFIADLRAAYPISDDVIEKRVLHEWIHGGPTQLKMEIMEAVREKTPKFTFKHITLFHNIVTEHETKTPLEGPSSAMTSSRVEQNALDLTMQQITYDVHAVRVWAGRVKNVEQNAFHRRLEAQQQAARKNKAAAEDFLATNMVFDHMQTLDQVLTKITTMQTALEKRGQVDRGCARTKDHRSVTLIMLNWAAPSSITAQTMQVQANAIGCLLNEGTQNIALMLSPMHSYKKGGVWAAERNAVNLLADKALVLDRSWSLIFAEQRDKRDSRPLQFKGRVVEPPNVDPSRSWWRNTKIFRGYTEPAMQVTSREMVVPEDVMPEALPSTIDDSPALVQGAAKYQQIGADAAKKVLQGILEDSTIPAGMPLLLVDLHAGVGNFADAFLELRADFKRPMSYVGFTEDAMTREWLQEVKTERTAQMITKSEMKIPGHSPEPNNVDALVETKPECPVLNIMTLGKLDKWGLPETLHLPPHSAQKWLDHQQFATQFRSFLDELVDKNPDMSISLSDEPQKGQEANNTQGEQTPSKRRAGDTSSPTPNRKKPKTDTTVDPGHLLPTESGCAPLTEIKLPSANGPTGMLRIFLHNKMQIANTSNDEELVAPRGALLAGFGRGKWEAATGAIDESKQIQFTLESHSDMVLHGPQLVELLDVVNEKRKTQPDCRVAYHDLVPLAEGPAGAFGLKQTVGVVFNPQAQTADANPAALQTRLAATVPAQAWKGHYSGLVWSVKWAANGLAPIRPQIVMLHDVMIKPGHSLLLN